MGTKNKPGAGGRGRRMTKSELGPLTDDLVEILGMPNFRAGPIAHLFVAVGEAKIPPSSEREQAFVVHWLCCSLLYLELDWCREAFTVGDSPWASVPLIEAQVMAEQAGRSL